MRRSHSLVVLGLLALICTLQLNTAGCPGTGGAGGGIFFGAPPTVRLETNPAPPHGVPPFVVEFNSDNSTDDGVITQRAWDFGDGSETNHDIAPVHTYLNAGEYTARLTLTDDDGMQASRTVTVTVTEEPVAVIAVDRDYADRAPARFVFDASASYDPDMTDGDEALTYYWDFGDGARETDAIVQHTFAAAGTYRVKLTVTDNVGVTGTSEKVIEVGIPRPTLEFRTPPDDMVNIVYTTESKLWTQVVYDVEPGVPFTLRAGLDGDRDGCNAQVALYNAGTGAERYRLTGPDGYGHERPVTSAVFSADSLFVLSGGRDGRARLYSVLTGDFLQEYVGANQNVVNAVAISPNGLTVALGRSDGAVELRATSDSSLIRALAGHTTSVSAVAFSPDGTRICSGDAGGLAILNAVSDGTELARMAHAEAVTSVAYSPGNSNLVLTGCRDRVARMWNSNGQLVQQYAPVTSGGTLLAGHADGITAVAFAKSGTLVLTGSADATAKIWDAVSGAELRTFTGHTQEVTGVGFSPDGTQVITGSADGTARIWSATDATVVRELAPCTSAVIAVEFSADGATILVGVAAENDIPLDEDLRDGVEVQDLNLRIPTPLSLDREASLAGTTGKRYYLWTELATDRTVPTRTYANPTINVLGPLPSNIGGTPPPVVPLVTNDAGRDEASVIIAPRPAYPLPGNRQIFDIGRMDLGDRLYLSLLTSPGYSETYQHNGFGLMVLDGQQELYAWYMDGLVFFSPNTKMIVGRTSASYYLVVDSYIDGETPSYPPSVNVQIQRAAASDSQPRRQYVYLDFNGTDSEIAVADQPTFAVAPFVVDAATDALLMEGIVTRVENLLAPYNVVVYSSSRGETEPIEPHNVIYFVTGSELEAVIEDRNGDGTINTDDLDFFGLTNYIDPRNTTLTGRSVVDVHALLNTFGGLSVGQKGTTIGNVTVHHLGFLAGLRETTGVNTDIMTSSTALATSSILDFTVAPLKAETGRPAIGIQNAPELLTELYRK